MNLSFTDCNGNVGTLDKFHLHEIVDRLYCARTMIEELLLNHPASPLCIEELTEVQEALGHAYQNMGSIACYMEENK